jgi:hypothetical protein
VLKFAFSSQNVEKKIILSKKRGEITRFDGTQFEPKIQGKDYQNDEFFFKTPKGTGICAPASNSGYMSQNTYSDRNLTHGP